MKIVFILIYYVIMNIASFATTMFGFLILFEPQYVSEDVLRIPLGIALLLVGFLSSYRYLRLGFDDANYYTNNIKF